MIQMPEKRGRAGTGATYMVDRALLRVSLVIMGGVALLVFWIKGVPLLFNSYNFQPHGMCYLWLPNLVALHVGSDALIGLSYVSISATLAYLVYKTRRDIPFQWVFIAFGIFIIACAGTHFLEIWTLWNATYWLSGSVKLLTAIASVATAIVLPPMLPKVYAIIEFARASNEQKQQLESAHQELEALYKKSKELDELKTRFFANISHELRTPLTLILGPVQNLLAEEHLTGKQKRNLAVAERNALILLKHVNDLLDLSKIEAGSMEITYEDVDLMHLLRECITSFEALAQERQIAVAFESPEPILTRGDSRKLQRIYLNLLSNAFKFTPAGGRVRCVLRRAGERGIVTIQDSGPGVQPALRTAIFERFRQGDSDEARYGSGTGLGLAIVKEFVELHAGTVMASDAPGEGAIFTVDLPLVTPVYNAVHSATLSSQIQEQSASHFPAERATGKQWYTPMDIPALQEGEDTSPLVLIIEDNPEITYLIADTLAPMYRVATARDGKEGLEKALTLEPDLILCDIMMPVMSGDLFVSEARTRPELALIPILILSARTDSQVPVHLLRTGAQDYLAKPFLPEELRARAANLIALYQVRRVLQQEATQQNLTVAELATEVTLRKRESEQMVIALQESEKRKDLFLSMASHELKTPLTSLKVFTHVLVKMQQKDKNPDMARLRYLEKMDIQINKLIKLIAELLDISRVQTGKLTLTEEYFDGDTFVQDIVGMTQHTSPTHSITIMGVMQRQFYGDKDRLGQVLINLLTNAIKFSPAPGPIEVIVTADQKQATFGVRDRGIGIPHDQQALIFERFHRVYGDRDRKYPGLGIGLYIASEIVQRHGGQIWVESVEGRGSTFFFSIPLAGEDHATTLSVPHSA